MLVALAVLGEQVVLEISEGSSKLSDSVVLQKRRLDLSVHPRVLTSHSKRPVGLLGTG